MKLDLIDRHPTRVLWILCATAFILRLAAIVLLRAWEQPSPMEHASIAENLLRGEGFAFGQFDYFGPSSVQSPPYPLFLAGLFAVFGIHSPVAFAAAMVVNAVLGALGVWLTYQVGQVWGASTRISLLAAALYTVWPTQIYAATAAQAITMITVAVLAMIVLHDRARDTRRTSTWILFSVVGCLAALTEPVLLPAMLLTGMILAIRPRSWPLRTRARFALVLFVTGLIILGPWTLRNWVVHERLMPVKSTFWVNVWKGNNPNATGTDRLPLSEEQRETLRSTPLLSRHRLARSPEFDTARQYDRLTTEQLERLSGKTDAAREQVFREFTVEWIQDHPSQYLQLCAGRFLKTVWLEWENPKSWNAVYFVSRTLLLLGTIAGLVLAVRRRWRLGYTAMLVGTSMLLITLTITAARFALPFEPLQMILCVAVILPGSRSGGPAASHLPSTV